MCTPALAAAEAVGLAHRVIRHDPVRSLAEAARARGVAPADVVKTLVVRRGEDDFPFVLSLSATSPIASSEPSERDEIPAAGGEYRTLE